MTAPPTTFPRRLADLSPGERAGLLDGLRRLDPGLPAWKHRPLVLDIARALLAAIQRHDTSGFLELNAALARLGVDPRGEALDFATATHACGDHVIHLAIAYGAEAIAHALLADGGYRDHPAGPDGLRPLHVAVLADHAGLIRHLLDRGADPDAPDARGRSPRALAETVAWKRGLSQGKALLGAPSPGRDATGKPV